MALAPDHLPEAESLDQERKCCRGLAAARIIEVIASIERAPILQHALEAALGEVRPYQILRHIREAETGECRVEHLECAVEGELAFDAHFLEKPTAVIQPQ